ncbi:hypothetical protein [Nostoc sp. T09]|uniref:hypothetical protein n=1 Tax=Nostoc sp. T09 TaxID=1932621 RepID=UPI00211B302A|nr:hypothetical protein [Nostoc sp. T09]
MKDASSNREQRIKQLSNEDPALAELLAIIHFEWTVRRAIIALGTSSNYEIRQALEQCHGLKRYKELWKKEVVQGGLDKASPVTHKSLNTVISYWEGLIKAFDLRHRLVHGVGSCSTEYAIERLGWAIVAAGDVRTYCLDYNINIDARLPVRRRVTISQSGM